MAITGSTLVSVKTNSTFWKRQYTAMYYVSTDAPTTDLRSIVEYSGIPKYGESFDSSDEASVVQSKQAREINGTRTKFEVTVNYEPYERSGHNSVSDEFDNPLDAPSEYTWGFSSRQEVVQRDLLTNLQVRNTAGDQFIPAVEVEKYDLKLTVVQNLEVFEPREARLLVGSVNSRAFTVAGFQVGIKEALCIERSATSEVFVDQESDERVEYWQVKTELIFRQNNVPTDEFDLNKGAIQGENAWHAVVLNAGLDQLKDPNVLGAQVACLDDDGKETTTPKTLKKDGTQETNPDNAIYMSIEVYPSADFGAMQL